ncbi:hypothetical protein L3X38_011020 [Prunus dulcis]|uniref:Uncharacterized protein n=1 Tax=Prunus dulcis TaxID=3755 RepID=A0AAD4WI94_PRUDU|nr:hypothetical protein L3X38_011020 [Prunus dulcis]
MKWDRDWESEVEMGTAHATAGLPEAEQTTALNLWSKPLNFQFQNINKESEPATGARIGPLFQFLLYQAFLQYI